jgi:hypothetical protein
MDLVVIYTFVSYIYIVSAGQHHDSQPLGVHLQLPQKIRIEPLGFVWKCHRRSGLNLLGSSRNVIEDQDADL